jgi:hypothetical protein
VQRKWNAFIGLARRARTKARQNARATGGGAAGPALDPLFELVLSAAEANTDLFSDTDSEARPANQIRLRDLGKFIIYFFI